MSATPTTRLLIVRLLERDGPMSAATIAAQLSMNIRTVCGVIRDARRARAVHVSGWKRSLGTRGRIGAVYGVGNKPDVRQVAPLDSKTRNAAYRERHRTLLRMRERARRGDPTAAATWLTGL